MPLAARLPGLPVVPGGQPGTAAARLFLRAVSADDLYELVGLVPWEDHVDGDRDSRRRSHLRRQPRPSRSGQHPLPRATSQGRGRRPLPRPDRQAARRRSRPARHPHQRAPGPRRGHRQPRPLGGRPSSPGLPPGGRGGSPQGEPGRGHPPARRVAAPRRAGRPLARPHVRLGHPAGGGRFDGRRHRPGIGPRATSASSDGRASSRRAWAELVEEAGSAAARQGMADPSADLRVRRRPEGHRHGPRQRPQGRPGRAHPSRAGASCASLCRSVPGVQAHSGLVVTNPPYGKRLGEVADWCPLRDAGREAQGFLLRMGGGRLHRQPRIVGASGHARPPRERPLQRSPRLQAPAVPTWERRSRRRDEPAEPDRRANWDRSRRPARDLAQHSDCPPAPRCSPTAWRRTTSTCGAWAAREDIHCYRVYDADLPEYAAAVDLYDDRLHVQEYAPPGHRRPRAGQAAAEGHDGCRPPGARSPGEHAVLKVRRPQRGAEQYQKLGQTRAGWRSRRAVCASW